MSYIKLIAAALLLALIGYAIYMTSRNIHLGNERDRWQDNYYSDKDEYANNKNFNLSDFKKYLELREDKLLDSISNIVGFKINPNNVSEINNINYHYHDTTIVTMELEESEPEIYPFYYMDKKECLNMTGYFDLNDTTMNITDSEFKTGITCMEFHKRDKVKWLLGLRIGKKHNYKECVDNCSGETTVEEISVN